MKNREKTALGQQEGHFFPLRLPDVYFLARDSQHIGPLPDYLWVIGRNEKETGIGLLKEQPAKKPEHFVQQIPRADGAQVRQCICWCSRCIGILQCLVPVGDPASGCASPCQP